VRTVVVGAGAAGLWCALHAAERGPVTVVAPGAALLTATAWAQGGVAAALGEGDSPEAHARDTLAAGAGLCDERAVDVLVRGAPEEVSSLQAMGMEFDAGGAPTLEGGHSARRVLHAGGDASGRVLHRFLADTVAADGRIERVDALASAIAVSGHRATGVTLHDGRVVDAVRVVLATGGACGIYGHRTGPDTSIGGGLALAWTAGAALADMEFVQFHPTALDVPGHPARLLTEALRGEGAVLRDASGRRFMERFHPLAELAPRDVVARAVLQVREETGAPVFLDAREVPDVARRFPVAEMQCMEVGLDITRTPIPVAPAAHYFVGGVLTDTWGRTSVPELYAAGECASTGVHGANRLASNSLAEALVFGHRAAVAEGGPAELGLTAEREPLPEPRPANGLPLAEVRELADRFLGVRRSDPELRDLLNELAGRDAEGGVLAATLVAWLVALAALRREESRGGHFRTDFPEPREEWRFHQAIDPGGWRRVPLVQHPTVSSGL
jgi:L-aspartate oxidase